jgi:hypothetical protein
MNDPLPDTGGAGVNEPLPSDPVRGAEKRMGRLHDLLLLAVMAAALLAVVPAQAVDGAATDAPASAERIPNNKAYGRKSDNDSRLDTVLKVATAAIALLGTALPLLTKSLGTYSASTRGRRQLQRIQDLTDLLGKIKKDNALSPEAMEAVSAQVHAEVTASLAELRHHRERQEKEALATETIRADDFGQPGKLPTWRRLLLLFRPRGIAWVPHLIFYLYAMATFSTIFLNLAGEGGMEELKVFVPLMGVAWVWAWFARRRWDRRQRAIESVASAPVRPANASGRPETKGAREVAEGQLQAK